MEDKSGDDQLSAAQEVCENVGHCNGEERMTGVESVVEEENEDAGGDQVKVGCGLGRFGDMAAVDYANWKSCLGNS